MIDRDTTLCISVASRPSNFGTTVHNAGYRACGLNFVYKAFGITDIKGAMTGVRALGIRGCSISMPFKEKVIPYLDEIDESVGVIGAVNTVVNEGGCLKGYNTDAVGAEKVLRDLSVTPEAKVVVLGAGGVAKAILYSLRKLGVTDIVLCNRTVARSEHLSGGSITVVAWEGRAGLQGDLLINATSVGMTPDDARMPVAEEVLSRFSKVMDVVISPMESLLVREARARGIAAAEGYKMSLQQAVAQFELYTGQAAPVQAMEDAVIGLLKGRK
jgi:shikimate dehydrogenase